MDSEPPAGRVRPVAYPPPPSMHPHLPTLARGPTHGRHYITQIVIFWEKNSHPQTLKKIPVKSFWDSELHSLKRKYDSLNRIKRPSTAAKQERKKAKRAYFEARTNKKKAYLAKCKGFWQDFRKVSHVKAWDFLRFFRSGNSSAECKCSNAVQEQQYEKIGA